jgi:cardiolipin synthase
MAAGVAMLAELGLRHWVTLHGLVTLLGLVVYLAASHGLRQRRHPSAAIAWVISLALIPYVALPLYLLLGSRKLRPLRPLRAARRASDALTASPDPRCPVDGFEALAAAMRLPAAASYSDLSLHQDGQQALDALRELANGAAFSLDVCTFLLGRDALGREITQLLARRAREGVHVRLLVDGIGQYLGARPDLKTLRAAGVQVALFVPPFKAPWPGRINLRNHRKMAVADGQRAWTGGRNLAAEYFLGERGTKPPRPWTDLSFCFSGELARQVQRRFDDDWAFATGQTVQLRPPLAAALDPAAASLTVLARAQLVPSGPDQDDDTFYTLLISSCFTARRSIMAVTPYFVPDATLLMALVLAARRGVRIDLVLPRKSNHRLADVARHAALRQLCAAGAQVWLAPRMVHAKAVVFDRELVMAGSANLDERSLFLNYELMFAFYEPEDVQRFAQWLERLRDSAALYNARSPSVTRAFAEGLVRSLAFQL